MLYPGLVEVSNQKPVVLSSILQQNNCQSSKLNCWVKKLQFWKKNTSWAQKLKQTKFSKYNSDDWCECTTENFLPVTETSMWKTFDRNSCGSLRLECKFWPRCKTGVTVTKLFKSQNHSQINSEPNAHGLSCWWRKSFLSKQIIQIKVLTKLPE